MVEPWFDPNTFGACFGYVVGGGGGTLLGLTGAAMGVLVPQGRGRRAFTAILGAFLAVGLLALGAGIAALIAHQPFGIWYPFLLCGLIFTLLTGLFLAMLPYLYRAARQQREALQAPPTR